MRSLGRRLLTLAGELFQQLDLDLLNLEEALVLATEQVREQLMMAMFTSTARELRSTLESIATLCSVKANGRESERRYFWDVVTICDLIASSSSLVSWKTKSSGKRFLFLRKV